ncbi:MAG TPA: hypothetical protein DCS29_02850 [Candidatus Magasanikbacteria bacterium]|nr:MAG: hypothetical protein A2479_00805 [Candidatus Magasanikbacteria bacterium RIFOXYC2_FULL_39_8]HAT03690.1 hypothetical protein [Candidatus Magasanikbacteria bacterium]
MNFNEAYNYIISLSNLPRKEYMTDPRHCGWYLKRLQFFLDILGNPERKIPHYIHVTGTSGKGSVTAYMHSILHAAGKKVGSTYSPHPTCIIERWKIGNKFMTKKEFTELVEYIKPKLDEYTATTPYDALSFFEITEAIGFLYFTKHKVDWAVLEVACGGRYDASNIIPWKDIAAITNIGLDHVGLIGNNKSEIAYEKAGIIKRGCTFFTTEKEKRIIDVLTKEAKKYLDIKDIKILNIPISQYPISNISLRGADFSYLNQSYHLPTIGNHQIKNAILCIEIAKHIGISEQAIRQGLKHVYQPLRMEIVSRSPLVILDGAHNPDKMKTTVSTIKNIPISPRLPSLRPGVAGRQYPNTHFIVGFSGDKNIPNMIKQLSTLKPISIAVTRNTTNPFRKVADLQNVTKQFKKLLPKTKIKLFLDPHDALIWTKKIAKTHDIILATGSIFVSGELRKKI